MKISNIFSLDLAIRYDNQSRITFDREPHHGRSWAIMDRGACRSCFKHMILVLLDGKGRYESTCYDFNCT